jgi:hypothetical protein
MGGQARVGEQAVESILWLPCWGDREGGGVTVDRLQCARDSPAHDLSGPKIDGSLNTSKPALPR